MSEAESDFDNIMWRDEDNAFYEDDSRPPASLSPPDLHAAGNSSFSRTGAAALADRTHHVSEDSSPDLITSPEHNGARGQTTGRPSMVEYPPITEGVLDCTVGSPLKENDGTKDAYISYLITIHTDFKTFQRADFSVRRRFTDFLFLHKSLNREYPAAAIPPIPDKNMMEYVRGDRFGTEFTQRRAWSLHRFVKRLTLHPLLRRAPVFAVFLESPDWNAYMNRSTLRISASAGPDSNVSPGLWDNVTDTLVNAFTKLNKPDRRFIEVRERADKLDEDLSYVEKTVSRVVRRESDLESDYLDLATQFRKLVTLETDIEVPLQIFAASVDETARGMKTLKDHTDLNYLTSLRDMEAYIVSLRALLRSREQKQLDYEALIDYRNKAVTDRDMLSHANAPYHTSNRLVGGNPASFIRSKMDDMRGVDHETARLERARKLDMRIDELTTEVESAKTTSELFDAEVVREVSDFERIRALEFKDTMGTLADKHIDYYQGVLNTWERFVAEMEVDAENVERKQDDGEAKTEPSSPI